MRSITITTRTVYIFLTLVGLAVYCNSFRVPFQYDDFHFLREQINLKSFPLFFDWITQSYGGLTGGRTFLLFTFYLNYAISGLDTFGYHIANLFIHIATAMLFYVLLATYVDTEKDDQYHVKSILAATLFLVHPIAVESVTYISSRSSGLSAFFVLATMLLFFKATRGAFRLVPYLLSILCFLLGLATKEAALVTPVLLLLFDRYFPSDHKETVRARIKYHLPFWIIIAAGAFGFIRQVIVHPEMYDRPWPVHLLTEGKAVVEYLWLLIFPAGLTIDHGLRESLSFDWPALRAIIIIAGLFFLAFLMRKKNRVLSFSLLWFFVNVAPFFIVRLSDYMAERWVYAASLGFALGMSEALLIVVRRHRRTGIAVILGIIVLWGTLTLMRNAVFQDPLALWADAARKAPEKSRPYTNLCGAYLERGNITMAVQMCSTAVEKGSDDDETYINLSSAHFYNRDMKKAEAILLSRSRTSTNSVYHYNLGIIYSREKEYDKAISQFQQVLKKKPNSLAAYASIGEIYLELNDKKKADEYYRMAIQQIPQSGEDYLLMAVGYSQLGQPEKVSECFSRALRTEPLNINIRLAIANEYFIRKMYAEAYRHYSIIARLAPNSSVAPIGMGKAMLGKGDLEEAKKQFTRALSLVPQDSPEREDLLKMLKKAGA